MQHQVANLAGSLDGTPPVVLGATVDGPARGKSNGGVQFTEDVGSWATVEPADDYTVPTVLIFARLAAQ